MHQAKELKYDILSHTLYKGFLPIDQEKFFGHNNFLNFLE